MNRTAALRLRQVALLVATAMLAVACGAGPASPSPSGSPAPSTAGGAGASAAPGSTTAAVASPPGTGQPAPTARRESAPPASPVPSASLVPSAPPPSATSSPSDTPAGPSSSCSGSDENRDFFAAVAQAVAWRVYCAVLPTGWFLESGTYRLAGGGRLTVVYRGPDGARLVLREGAYCTGGLSACAPRSHERGDATYGDMGGALVDLGSNQPGDGYAVYVNPGSTPPSWAATGTNLEMAIFVALVAELHRVE